MPQSQEKCCTVQSLMQWAELNVTLALQVCLGLCRCVWGYLSMAKVLRSSWAVHSVPSQKGPSQTTAFLSLFLLRTPQNAYHTINTPWCSSGQSPSFPRGWILTSTSEFILVTRLSTPCSQCQSAADGRAVSGLPKVEWLPPFSQSEKVTMWSTFKLGVGQLTILASWW